VEEWEQGGFEAGGGAVRGCEALKSAGANLGMVGDWLGE
jgi:hypothetical protein